ncbi:MAG TPA: DUF4145 domain-containing protein, partial [Dysgonamonadaceae bacterium]|nr:DUF4145 domain-containing protein [Dysgonamonadaceae bacterium]
MNSNFLFLKNEFATFFDRAVKSEQTVITDPRTSLVYCRMALEEAINWMFANDEELEMPYDTSLNSLMVQTQFKEQFNHKLYNELHIIRKTGNLASHNKPVNDVDAHNAIEALFYFAKWFGKSYAQETYEDIGIFDFEVIPREGPGALSKRQIQDLQEKLDKELKSYQSQLLTKEEERQQLADKNELFRKQIEDLQAQLQANKVAANVTDEVMHPRNEAETRKYIIDLALREAGWDLNGIN